MIIRTETYRDMEEDIAKVMGMNEIFIYKKLHEMNDSCRDNYKFDWDKFESSVEDMITECADLDLIDEIYIYHLARHFIEPEELLPLKELLLTKNPFSDFLSNHRIYFLEQNGRIEFYYQGRLISPDEILSSGQFNLLARRLGYLGEADYCVNGFAFWPDIEKTSDGYFGDLQRSPEIIENIGRYIRKDLWREYQDKTKYYGVVFRIPIEDVIFDNKNNVNTKGEKIRCFIKYALFTLRDCYYNCPGGSNIMLRISDNKKVKVDHCILIDES